MRNLFLLSVLASAALLASGAAAAQTAPAATPADATPAAKPVKEKKICRAEDSSTSRLPKRICKTKEEWDGTPKQDIDKIKRD
jgi:hypothetical protein